MKTLCGNCILLGYCQKETAQLVRDTELNNPEFIRDARNFGAGLDYTAEQWTELPHDLYRDYLGRILDKERNQIILNMEYLNIEREWYRDFFSHVPEQVVPRIQKRVKPRVRALLTILRATYPSNAILWGVRAANDNAPTKTSTYRR